MLRPWHCLVFIALALLVVGLTDACCASALRLGACCRMPESIADLHPVAAAVLPQLPAVKTSASPLLPGIPWCGQLTVKQQKKFSSRSHLLDEFAHFDISPIQWMQ